MKTNTETDVRLGLMRRTFPSRTAGETHFSYTHRPSASLEKHLDRWKQNLDKINRGGLLHKTVNSFESDPTETRSPSYSNEAVQCSSESGLASYAPCTRKPTNNSTCSIGDGTSFHFVLGNTSCDIDSLCCTLAYGILLDEIEDSNKQMSVESAAKRYVIPIMNIRRREFKLKLQAKAWLLAGLNLELSDSSLIFRDDPEISHIFDNPGVCQNGPWFITLVDHNTLDSRQTNLAPHVYYVIDHHEDNFLLPQNTVRRPPRKLSNSKRAGSNATQEDASALLSDFLQNRQSRFVAFHTGSCCTLVSLIWLAWSETQGGGPTDNEAERLRRQAEFCDHDALRLLLGGIIRDTDFFDAALEGHRWGPADLSVFNSIRGALGPEIITLDTCQELLDRVNRVRFDVKEYVSLGLKNVLIMDFKIFCYNLTSNEGIETLSSQINIGYSSVEVSIEEILKNFDKEHFKEIAESHLSDNGLDIAIIISQHLSSKPSITFIGGWSNDPSRKEQIRGAIFDAANLPLPGYFFGEFSYGQVAGPRPLSRKLYEKAFRSSLSKFLDASIRLA
eukprot:GHVP01024906.1.p1 GENE.GHVP01024906.1~~GHVP01024906.1.p1  ORF type:complete len:560 (-),score=71.51 GHVP01024906.1:1255-2934(-)